MIPVYPSGVDPLLQPKWWDNPDLVRESPAVRSYRYYEEINPTLDVWHEYIFLDQGRTDENFESNGFCLANDGAFNIDFSFDGVTIHGQLGPSEVKTDDQRRERHVYIRNSVALSASQARIWAW